MSYCPNILICGTPGTGKSTLCQELSNKYSNLQYHSVSELVRDNDYHEGYDEKLETFILDEDKLLDDLEIKLGNERDPSIINLVEYHHSELFPERWFDLVIILRCENKILYERLQSRNYNQLKIENNLQTEIFGILAEEAKESYPSKTVIELQSNSVEDMEDNFEQICNWIDQFN